LCISSSFIIHHTSYIMTEAGEETKSALQDNIEKKGKNAYYFAHAHKANGPQWDGKPEPKLLSKQSTTSSTASSSNSTEEIQSKSVISSFDYHKSNITSYAFCNNERTVKLYLELKGVGDKCTDQDIVLQSTNTSLDFVLHNYDPTTPQCLHFAKLARPIQKATYKLKPDRIILTLTKETPGEEWITVTDKGASPDHEVV